jgi:hypothetical protein
MYITRGSTCVQLANMPADAANPLPTPLLVVRSYTHLQQNGYHRRPTTMNWLLSNAVAAGATFLAVLAKEASAVAIEHKHHHQLMVGDVDYVTNGGTSRGNAEVVVAAALASAATAMIFLCVGKKHETKSGGGRSGVHADHARDSATVEELPPNSTTVVATTKNDAPSRRKNFVQYMIDAKKAELAEKWAPEPTGVG